MRQITVKIKKDGTVQLEANEYHGQMCKAALEEVIQKMGAEATQFTPKAEYYEEATEQQTLWG